MQASSTLVKKPDVSHWHAKRPGCAVANKAGCLARTCRAWQKSFVSHLFSRSVKPAAAQARQSCHRHRGQCHAQKLPLSLCSHPSAARPSGCHSTNMYNTTVCLIIYSTPQSSPRNHIISIPYLYFRLHLQPFRAVATIDADKLSLPSPAANATPTNQQPSKARPSPT